MEDETRRSNPRQRGGGLALYSNTKSYEREKENRRERRRKRERERERQGGRKGKRERDRERERESEEERETRRPLHLGEHRRLERNGRSSTQRSGEGEERNSGQRGAVAGSTCRNSVTHASARELCASDAGGERERLGRRRKEGGEELSLTPWLRGDGEGRPLTSFASPMLNPQREPLSSRCATCVHLDAHRSRGRAFACA